MKNKTIAIVQARMSSTRLPGKVLKPLAGLPVIWHIHNRLTQCKLIDRIVVATSTHETDDELARYCEENGIECYRGSLDDVLSRFLSILKKYPEYSYVARITGDCPLIHPQFIDNQITALSKYDGDVTWCGNIGSAFVGQGVHSVGSIFLAEKNSTDPRDRMDAAGGIYLARNPQYFRIVELCPPANMVVENLRLTIDEEKDYDLFSKIFDLLWHKNNWIELGDVLALLKQFPDLGEINNDIPNSELNQEVLLLKERWAKAKKIGYMEYSDKLI